MSRCCVTCGIWTVEFVLVALTIGVPLQIRSLGLTTVQALAPLFAFLAFNCALLVWYVRRKHTRREENYSSNTSSLRIALPPPRPLLSPPSEETDLGVEVHV